MKKIILLIAAFSGLFLTQSLAQKMSVQWSKKQFYENKLDGFFDGFIGGNSKYIYAKFSNYTTKKVKGFDKRVKLLVFDKLTMKKVGDQTLIDVKDKKKAKKYEGLKYYSTIVFEDVLHVFWTKDSKTGRDLYAESYNSKLKSVMKLKKVYAVKSGGKSGKYAQLFVMGTGDVSQKVLIGAEVSSAKGGKVVTKYKLLNSDLSFAEANQFTLPIVTTRKGLGPTSRYELGADNNLHVKTSVRLSREERKKAKKGAATSYTIYSVVDLETGNLRTYPIKFDNKNIFDFDFIVSKNSIKIFGLFSDLVKDPRGNDTHGIFHGVLDSKSLELNDLNFSYFTKTQLDNLFAGDRDERRRKKSTRSNKKKKSKDESIAANYVIEYVQAVDDRNIVLFCSRMNNYSVRTCDSKGNCSTNYYCEKSNVTAFKIAHDGSIEWASNLDRKITYSGWNIFDLRVAYKSGRLYVTYGSNYAISAEKKKGSTKKSKRYKSDRFEYAVFDYETGQFFKKEYKVNRLDTPKKDRKTISAMSIQVIDGAFYTSSTKLKIKPQGYIIGCASALVCAPLILLPWYLPSFRRGDGYLASISLD
ncbi:MAG: hypothetical protein JKX76_03715 [Colwellia sp.]|nr:hypothetical protein [Colwellia sp.]